MTSTLQLTPSMMVNYGSSLIPTAPGMLPETPFPLMVLNNDNRPANSPAEKLTDSQSTQSMMAGYYTYLDSIFPLANYHPDTLIAHKGWEYLYEMMHMAAVRTPIHLKLQAALYKEAQVITAVESKEKEKTTGDYEKAQEAVELCQYLIENIRNPETSRSMPFRGLLWNIGQAVPYGFSTNELVWRYEDKGKYKGKRFLKTVAYRPNHQVGFDLDDETMEVLNVTSFTPRTGRQKKHIPVKKVLLATFNQVQGLPYGDGDLRCMAKHHFAIDSGLKWWGIAQKKWGQPFIEGKLQNMNNANDRRIEMDAVMNGASWFHAALDEYTVHQVSAASLDSYGNFVSYHGMQMMLAVLGNTLTTTQGDGSSSFALGQTHQSSQNFFLGNPRHLIEATITKGLFERCVEYNLGEEYIHLTPSLFLGHWDDSERKLIAEFYEILAEMGAFDPREPWVRKELKIPEMPEGFDPNDDKLPLLPGRERITIDPTSTAPVPGKRKRPTSKLGFVREKQDAVILAAAQILTDRHSAGLAKDIETAKELEEVA